MGRDSVEADKATRAATGMTGMRPAARRGSAKGGGKADGLGPNSEIGRKLKQYYDELVSDEVPDRLIDLLKQLEKSEKAVPGGSKGDA
jgi:hypothetical protein